MRLALSEPRRDHDRAARIKLGLRRRRRLPPVRHLLIEATRPFRGGRVAQLLYALKCEHTPVQPVKRRKDFAWSRRTPLLPPGLPWLLLAQTPARAGVPRSRCPPRSPPRGAAGAMGVGAGRWSRRTRAKRRLRRSTGDGVSARHARGRVDMRPSSLVAMAYPGRSSGRPLSGGAAAKPSSSRRWGTSARARTRSGSRLSSLSSGVRLPIGSPSGRPARYSWWSARRSPSADSSLTLHRQIAGKDRVRSFRNGETCKRPM